MESVENRYRVTLLLTSDLEEDEIYSAVEKLKSKNVQIEVVEHAELIGNGFFDTVPESSESSGCSDESYDSQDSWNEEDL